MASQVASRAASREIGRPGRLEFLEVAARLVVLGTPVFYTLGRVFSEGYWSALGVSPGLMNASAEDYVYLGLIVIVNGLALILPNGSGASWWIAPVLSVGIFAALAFNLWLLAKAKAWLNPRLEHVSFVTRRFFARRRVAGEALSMTSAIIGAIAALSLVFFVSAGALLLPVVIAHSVGTLRAEQLAQSLKTEKGRYSVVTSSALGSLPARLVECSDEYCVLYTENGIVPVPRSSVSWTTSMSRNDPAVGSASR